MKYATGASTPIISVANIGKIEIPLYDAATQRELEEKAREIEKALRESYKKIKICKQEINARWGQ